MLVTLQAIFRRGVWQAYFRLTFAAQRAQWLLVISAALRLVIIAFALLLPHSALIYLMAVTAAKNCQQSNEHESNRDCRRE